MLRFKNAYEKREVMVQFAGLTFMSLVACAMIIAAVLSSRAC